VNVEVAVKLLQKENKNELTALNNNINSILDEIKR
jgi:hypothetical protein